MDDNELKRLWAVYNHPANDSWGLVLVLSQIQKEFPETWMEHVNDVMKAMDVEDAGGFFMEDLGDD